MFRKIILFSINGGKKMKKIQTKEREIYLKQFRIDYWERFGALPTINELVRSTGNYCNPKSRVC